MQGLVKLIMNSLYGVQIRRDINESYYCKSETWMKTEFDENVLDYWKLTNRNYIVKMKKDDGLDDDCDIKNTLPAVLGAFILSNSKRIMNNFIREINGFDNNSIYYGDTDSLYIEKNYWDVLDKANLVGDGLCQGKNDYKTGGIFYGLFLAPKMKYCSTIDDYGIIQENKTFKRFNDSKRLLDRSQYFKMIEGKKISAMLPRSWKKSFDSGTIIPTKMRLDIYIYKNLFGSIFVYIHIHIMLFLSIKTRPNTSTFASFCFIVVQCFCQICLLCVTFEKLFLRYCEFWICFSIVNSVV